jgi:hypothetical protein
MDTLSWLLDSDPAISWQAMRDLTDASPAAIAAMRARVAREGIGAEILARQESDGSWHRDDAPVWLPTLFTLLFLRATGIDRAEPVVESAVARLEAGLRWNDYPGCWDLRPPEFGPIPTDRSFGCKPGGNPVFEGEEEPCINGGMLALGAYFGRPSETLARRLLAGQLDDGGWNCEAPRSTRSSFHTTICVLEGLLEYERAAPQIASQIASRTVSGIAAARRRGEEYLLKRGLFRRLSTGEVVDPAFLQFAFPPRYHYDVLRALDYLRNAGVPPDARAGDAFDLVESKRQADGRWLLDAAYNEALAFPFGESVGQPSRWNTLRALRVLRWYKQPGLDLARNQPATSGINP